MPAFGLVVNGQREILMIQRGYGKQKGKWSLPGGQRDKGENYKRTAVRETREETGIKMSADTLYYKGRRHNFEVWRGRKIGGRLKYQRRECLDAKWFQKDMLPDDESLAFGPDKIVMGKWAAENPGSRRVHYPRSPMTRAGFILLVNDRNEILLTRRKGGRRDGKWSLPGDKTKRGESRSDAAKKAAYKATGLQVDVDHLYYENRHKARVYLGKPQGNNSVKSGVRWFPIHELPTDGDLAFAVDVRTIDKWASEIGVSRR